MTRVSHWICAGIVLGYAGLSTAEPAVEDWDTETTQATISDPLEPVNRAIYRFNDLLDSYLLEPTARGYRKVTPAPVRRGLSNFFDNLSYPVVIFSDILQGRVRQTGSDISRFLVNTTVGIGGLFDPAKHMDLADHDEDFGQALGRWGVGPGPYLVLPLAGPSNLRDAVGSATDFFIPDPVSHISDRGARYATVAAKTVDGRYRLLEAGDVVEEGAVDPYAFVRESYRQKRESLIAE